MVLIDGSNSEKLAEIKKLLTQKQYLIMPIAAPGSGKSYISKQIADLCPNTAKIVSTDAIRKELFGSEDSQENNGLVLLTAHRLCRKYFYHGYSVIFDATNLTRKSRKFTIKQGIPYEMVSKVGKIAIDIDTDIETALERNRNRTRVVPEYRILEMNAEKRLPTEESGEFDYMAVINNA